MARITLLACLFAAAVPAPSKGAQPRPLRVVSPAVGAVIATHPLLAQQAADVVVRGTAPAGAAVTVRSSCSKLSCFTTAIADRRGRWKARLELVEASGLREVTLTSAAFTGGDVVETTLALAPQPTIGPEPPAGRRLVLIGDSLAVGTQRPLAAALPGWRITGDGRISRPLVEGMGILQRLAVVGAPATVLAFSLFTNDDPRAVDALEQAVRASVSQAQGGCVLWATIRRPPVAGVSYGAANRRLLALTLAPDLAGRLVVIPWSEEVARHPGWLARDRVHATAAGYLARGTLYAAAAERCAVV